MKSPIILYRNLVDNIYEADKEYFVAKKYFEVVNSRIDCKKQLVIGRYSVRPFYKELEIDLIKHGCQLINTFS